MANRVILHGAFQVENFGDTLLLSTFKRKIENKYPEIDLVVSNSSLHASKEAGLCRISRWKLLFEKSPIVFCGGGYLGERPSRKHKWGANLILRHLWIAFAAILKRQKYGFFGIGFGPLSYGWYRVPALKAIKYSARAAFRDEESIEFYKGYGGRKSIRMVGDAILSLTEKDFELTGSISTPERKVVAVHLMGGESDAPMRLAALNFILNRIKRISTQVKVVFFSDNGVGRAPDFFSWGGEVEKHVFKNPEETLKIIAESDFLITTKLHVGICGAVLNKKVLSLPLHTKTYRLYRQLGRTDVCLELWSATRDKLENKINYFFEEDCGPILIPEELADQANQCWSELYEYLDETL